MPSPNPNPYQVNPFICLYGDETAIAPYQAPGAVIVTGQGNWNTNPIFAASQAKGARILAYVDGVEAPLKPDKSYGGGLYDPQQVQPWIYKSNAGLMRYNTVDANNVPATYFTDIRPGSSWYRWLFNYCTALMQNPLLSGIFLDVVGKRPWSKISAWETWNPAEQDLWAFCCSQLCQDLDKARRSINPNFVIICNNLWGTDPVSLAALSSLNGFMIEHHPVTSTANTVLAATKLAYGLERMVVAIGMGDADAKGWSQIPGITHVGSQQSYRAVLPPPPVPPVRTDYRMLAVGPIPAQ